MGNVQSETTQESESAKDGEEKAHPVRSKPPDRGLRSSKHEPESQSSSLQVLEPPTAGQPLSSEPEGGDRQPGTPEMGKTHSKKSKLKLSSMWAQNLATGGIKEASLCDKDPGAEKRLLACVSRADLQSRQVAVLQEEPKGLKVVFRPPQGAATAAATYARDSSTKRPPTKGKSKPESGQPDQNLAGLPQEPPRPPLEKVAELGPVTEVPKEVTDTETSWTQHVRASAKECSEKAAHLSEPLPPFKKQPPGVLPGTEPSKVTKGVLPGPQFREERNASRPAPSGARKTLLSWGAGQKEKEPAGRRDRTPGCDGDSKGLASTPPPSLPVEPPQPLSSPGAKPEASEREGEAGTKDEAPGAEAVGSETMHELMEKGINFLCKVTIQPGQRPPSIKPAKPKPTVLSPGVSYADILKQCPQKKAPASAPGLPKALHHLTAAGKKLPAFKGLERSHPEDFSLTQLFLEHFKEAAPKEPAPHAPNQQVVTFFEEFSTSNPKGTEWQRPRPPTPYPQRRKGQGRKLPRFGTAVSQVVAFLGSNPKGDWFVQEEGQRPPDKATVSAGEEAGKGHVSSPGGGAKRADEPGFFQPVLPLFSEQEIPMEIDDPPLRPQRRPQGPDEGAKDTLPVKMTPCNASRGNLGPVVAAHSLQKDEATPVPPVCPTPHSPMETLEVPSPASAAPTPTPVGLVPDPKAPAASQARPKVRKQGASAPKSKEKLKSSGQSKAKTPKGKGHKQWPRGYGMTPALRLEGPPLFPPFEKVARPFYFGEPLDAPLPLDKSAGADSDATTTQASPKEDREADGPPAHHWPAFQVSDSCPMRCYCKHQAPRKLPKNVVAWLNPSSNHLAEPPWVATATLAVSLVAGTKFCLDAYKQQHVSNED